MPRTSASHRVRQNWGPPEKQFPTTASIRREELSDQIRPIVPHDGPKDFAVSAIFSAAALWKHRFPRLQAASRS